MSSAFKVQRKVRGPWRRYLDRLAPERPALHRYCCRLTGNVWDGEDLTQDTLIKVFSLLGKIDVQLENPRAYLIRTATNLWIDRVRHAARELAYAEFQSHEDSAVQASAETTVDAGNAAGALFRILHPQERAAVVLKETLDYSLEDIAALLNTSTGAIKAALHRGRGRLQGSMPEAGFPAPSHKLVEAFMQALAAQDLETLKSICAADLSVELVGGAEMNNFEQAGSFFKHAHASIPALGFGTGPRWEMADYHGEPMVLGFRTLYGQEGLNEIHRIEELEGQIVRVRTYCFCEDTLAAVANELGLAVIRRPLPYRSPSLPDVPRLLLKYLLGQRRN